MFISKIEKIAADLGKNFSDLQDVAREALLYGMNLVKTPGALKKAMKRIGDDSKEATTRWSGNAYLLVELPMALVQKRHKISDLEDFKFARAVLERAHYKELRQRVRNIPDITIEQIMHELMPEVRKRARSGRFLTQFDRMHGNIHDIEQDITDKTLVVINKEFMKFNSHATEDISKYISYCLGRKSKTYLRSKKPRMTMVRVEDHQDMERLMDDQAEIERDPIHDLEFKRDIRNFLSEPQRDAVLLFLGMAESELKDRFENFLTGHGKKTADLSQAHLKRYIALFLGIDVFALLQQNQELKEYLTEAV